MRIALTADLHFGSVPEGLAGELRDAFEYQHPDIIVIAGDLTLRASRTEFEEAAKWLRSLKPQTLVIPGNHDLPYWNVIGRFASPFHRYRDAMGAATLMPIIERQDGILLDFNTAGPWQPHLRWQEGVARRRDIDAATKALSSVPSDRFRAIAAHHPFLKVFEVPRARPVRRAHRALLAFAGAGVDLIMSGHTHQSFAIQTEIAGQTMVAVGAPTALSTRMRGEPNGFWIIDAHDHAIVCTLWLRAGGKFIPSNEKTFKRKTRLR